MEKEQLLKSPLIVEAIKLVLGFDEMFDKLEQKIILGSLSKSTLMNYGRCIAKISLHFKKIPIYLEEEQINKIKPIRGLPFNKILQTKNQTVFSFA